MGAHLFLWYGADGRAKHQSRQMRAMEAPESAQNCFWKCLRDSRKRPNVFFSLAGLPQMPKRSFFDLRGSRKRPNVLFSICGIPANAKTFFFSLAGLPQTPKRSFSDLRDSRKHFQKPFATSAHDGDLRHYPFAAIRRGGEDEIDARGDGLAVGAAAVPRELSAGRATLTDEVAVEVGDLHV